MRRTPGENSVFQYPVRFRRELAATTVRAQVVRTGYFRLPHGQYRLGAQFPIRSLVAASTMKRALAVKRFHLALRLAQFRRGRKALADGLSIHFAGQTEVWAVAELVPLMAVAVWFPQRPLAAVIDPRRKSPNSRLCIGMLERCFSRGGEGFRQSAPPSLTA